MIFDVGLKLKVVEVGVVDCSVRVRVFLGFVVIMVSSVVFIVVLFVMVLVVVRFVVNWGVVFIVKVISLSVLILFNI